MALCIEDEDNRISDLARYHIFFPPKIYFSRLFFHELSQKANTIYNILPDLISSLSTNTDRNFNFNSIMKYLFSFIEKDKQTESLVEKLCHRFRTTKGKFYFPRNFIEISRARMEKYCVLFVFVKL